MQKYKVLFSVFLGFAAFVAVFIWFSKTKPLSKTGISNFEDCVKAGNAIVYEHPRQCVANGKTFVEQGTPVNVCLTDADCGQNFYCKSGQCAVFAVRTMCQTDDDCELVNRDQNFACCWAGRCDQVDYSKDNWIAASKQWFEEQRSGVCPPQEQCGPAPMCATKITNDDYIAKCVNSACQKVLK